DEVGEVLNERRDLAFVDRVGDGHRIGEHDPDSRHREQDADGGNGAEDADAPRLHLVTWSMRPSGRWPWFDWPSLDRMTRRRDDPMLSEGVGGKNHRLT